MYNDGLLGDLAGCQVHRLDVTKPEQIRGVG